MTRCDLLLYTHSFEGGGAERVMVQLANYWAGEGVRVVLVVDVADGPLREDVNPAVEIFSLDQPRGLLAAPALARAIRARQPSGVVSAMTEQNISACIARYLAGFRGRVVAVEHNFMSTAMASKPMARRIMLTRLMCWTYPMADTVAAVSAEAARDLENLVGLAAGSVQVLHNPIWPLEVTPGLEAREVHSWFADDVPVLLTVGRLVDQKNHFNLLNALSILRKNQPIRLIILGEGPLQSALLRHAQTLEIADFVDFAGFRRNVADFLRCADMFVLSSDREGLPLSLMEALRMGTPVVSTDCRSGPRELLEDGRHGRLVPVRDPEALAGAVSETLNSSPDPETLMARAADFSTDAVASRYQELLFATNAS